MPLPPPVLPFSAVTPNYHHYYYYHINARYDKYDYLDVDVGYGIFQSGPSHFYIPDKTKPPWVANLGLFISILLIVTMIQCKVD